MVTQFLSGRVSTHSLSRLGCSEICAEVPRSPLRAAGFLLFICRTTVLVRSTAKTDKKVALGSFLDMRRDCLICPVLGDELP